MTIDNEIKETQSKLNKLLEAKQKIAQEIKSTIASRLIALGFYETKDYGDNHYAKSIDGDNRYSFWFYIDDCYNWGVADESLSCNLHESDEFDNFDDCYNDYLKNKDSWGFKKATVSFTSTIFTNTQNDWEEDMWSQLRFHTDKSEFKFCLQDD